MTKIATRSNRLSGVIAFEDDVEYGITRETATVVVESGMDVGAVVVRTLITPTGTAAAAIGNGDGVMGTITVAENANPGVYTLRITKVVANAGEFVLEGPSGAVVGLGNVATAFNGAGLSFTLADGSTDFALNTTIAITVAGTVKYKWVEAADVATLNDDVCVVIESDKDVPSLTAGDNTMTLLARGDAGVVGAALQYKDTLSAPQKAVVIAKLKAKRIFNRTQA